MVLDCMFLFLNYAFLFADKEAVERRLNVLQKQGVVYANSTEI